MYSELHLDTTRSPEFPKDSTISSRDSNRKSGRKKLDGVGADRGSSFRISIFKPDR